MGTWERINGGGHGGGVSRCRRQGNGSTSGISKDQSFVMRRGLGLGFMVVANHNGSDDGPITKFLIKHKSG